jgi:hypothetical protein
MKMKKMNKILTAVLFAALMTAATALNAQTMRYVKTQANGGATPNGSTSAAALNATSWAAATSDLQAAINVSSAGDAIYVAEGTYTPIYTASGYNSSTSTYPTTNGNLYNSFVMKAGVKIYGGFKASAPEASPDYRDTVMTDGIVQMRYKSILSGNCYHVVISAGSAVIGTDTARLDGFTITGSSAGISNYMPVNGLNIYNGAGGGIHNYYSSPVLNNVAIRGTFSSNGGGIYNESSSPVLTNVIISGNNVAKYGNNATSYGGGIYNDVIPPRYHII